MQNVENVLFQLVPFSKDVFSTKSLNRIENLQKRPLQFLLDDYESKHKKILNKAGRR